MFRVDALIHLLIHAIHLLDQHAFHFNIALGHSCTQDHKAEDTVSNLQHNSITQSFAKQIICYSHRLGGGLAVNQAGAAEKQATSSSWTQPHPPQWTVQVLEAATTMSMLHDISCSYIEGLLELHKQY